MAADFYNDTFTGSNGTALSAHTADVGGGYTIPGGTSSDMQLVGNGKIRQNTVGFTCLTQSVVTPPSANYLCEVVVTLLSASGKAGWSMRFIDSSNYLHFEYRTADGKYYLIETVAAGDNVLGSISDALGSPQTIQIAVAGQAAVLKKNGVVIIGPVTVNAALNVAGTLGTYAQGTLSDNVTGVQISAARATLYSAGGVLLPSQMSGIDGRYLSGGPA